MNLQNRKTLPKLHELQQQLNSIQKQSAECLEVSYFLSAFIKYFTFIRNLFILCV